MLAGLSVSPNRSFEMRRSLHVPCISLPFTCVLLVQNQCLTRPFPRSRRLYSAAAGAVFYSVPHAGSRLADWGWYLRYVGGSPAKHVRQLKTGPHLDVRAAPHFRHCLNSRPLARNCARHFLSNHRPHTPPLFSC